MNAAGVRPRFPTLYQLNPRIAIGEARGGGRGTFDSTFDATLDDLPDALLERTAAQGFDWIWPLGVWQTGTAGRLATRTPADLDHFRVDLPDVRPEDVCGSPFAITGYDVHLDFGGDAALGRLRGRLARRGQRLLLDFIPNHVALDHPWVQTHPEFFIGGVPEDLRRDPESYVALPTAGRERIFAHGRDPYFPAWKDTLQLNYRHAGLRAAMTAELERVADRCDGVRCDMAMLLEPDVIARVWGDRANPTDGSAPVDGPFWPAAIARVQQQHPGFLFIAEVYWDLEWRLQQAGFDFTYDKRLYDRLRAGQAGPVRDHLAADPAFRDRSLRFLENHDEPRAASVFPPERHRAAAVLAFLSPGGRLFHDGQLEGRRAHASIHLARRRVEPVDEAWRGFYDRLLACLRRPEVASADARWRLQAGADAAAAGANLIVSSWESPAGHLLIAVNFGPDSVRYELPLELPTPDTSGPTLANLLSDDSAENGIAQTSGRILTLDLPAWGAQVLQIR
jgi:hypothetical protein